MIAATRETSWTDTVCFTHISTGSNKAYVGRVHTVLLREWQNSCLHEHSFMFI